MRIGDPDKIADAIRRAITDEGDDINSALGALATVSGQLIGVIPDLKLSKSIRAQFINQMDVIARGYAGKKATIVHAAQEGSERS